MTQCEETRPLEGQAAGQPGLPEAVEAAPPPAEEQAGADELAALRQELEQQRAQAQEYLDGWQRERAELANARRRFEKERADISRYAQADLARQLLPVSDDFERALAAAPKSGRSQAWAKGIHMIHKKLLKVLESVEVRPIAVQAGEAFNPELHQAITHEESAGFESGTIIEVVQKGYWMGQSVLRPTLVRVAK